MSDPNAAGPPAPKPMPWWVRPGLAMTAMLIFFVALYWSTKTGDHTLVTTMFTAAVSLALTAAHFFFGGTNPPPSNPQQGA